MVVEVVLVRRHDPLPLTPAEPAHRVVLAEHPDAVGPDGHRVQLLGPGPLTGGHQGGEHRAVGVVQVQREVVDVGVAVLVDLGEVGLEVDAQQPADVVLR